jgi:hypothetical protein
VVDHPQSSTLGLLLWPGSSLLPAMPHLPPAHHERSKHDSPNEKRIRIAEPPKCPGFEFKALQVNDSSQSNQGTDHLVSQSPPLSRSLSRVPWATGYDPKSLIRWDSHCGTRLGPTHPVSGDGPTSQGYTYGPQLKMNPTKWGTMSPLLHPLIMCGPVGFRHLVALSICPGRRPGPLYTRGLLNTDKYRPAQFS